MTGHSVPGTGRAWPGLAGLCGSRSQKGGEGLSQVQQSPAPAPQRNQRSLPAQGQVRVSLGDSPPTQSWGCRCSPGWSGTNLSGAVPRPQVQERDKKCRGAPAVIQLLNPNQNTENSTEAGTTRTGEGGDRSACTLYTLCTKLPPNPGPGPPPRG